MVSRQMCATRKLICGVLIILSDSFCSHYFDKREPLFEWSHNPTSEFIHGVLGTNVMGVEQSRVSSPSCL